MTRLPSTGQKNFIESLLRDRDTTGTAYENWTPDWAKDGATFDAASAVITYLKTLPYKQSAKAEPGFYVRGDEAFKVVENKAKTGTYANRWTGRGWEYAPGVGRTLADLVPMTAEQAG